MSCQDGARGESPMVVVSIAQGHDPYRTTVECLRELDEAGVTLPNISLVKPNLACTLDSTGCTVTNVSVCEAVFDFFKSLGNEKIACAEGATRGHSEKPLTKTYTAFKNNGYRTIGEKVSGYLDFNTDKAGKWIKISSPGLDYDVELGIAECVIGNSVASVAKLKTHPIGLTLTMKNMMGVLCKARRLDTRYQVCSGWKSKRFMHGWGVASNAIPAESIPSKMALAKNLTVLAYHCKPSIGIVDGVVAMEGQGPLFGTPVNLGVVIASTDVVACDTVACEITGFNPVGTGYIYAAGKMGLGECSLDRIEVVGRKIEDVRHPLIQNKAFPLLKFSQESVDSIVEDVKKLV